MSVYVVAQLQFIDEARYRQYQAEFGRIFMQSTGKLLAADESPTVLEGEWRRNKVVLMEFPNETDALQFMNSPEYQAISENRKVGADTIGLLVQGL